jgi:hypothetical protein
VPYPPRDDQNLPLAGHRTSLRVWSDNFCRSDSADHSSSTIGPAPEDARRAVRAEAAKGIRVFKIWVDERVAGS